MIYVMGGERLRSVIYVTYPAGSVCTCSNGARTMKAKDTSGKALFNVPSGSWTVAATKGMDTASETVTVMEGTATVVPLSYSLVLFADGTDNTAITGGWTPAPVNGRVQVQASVNNITGTGEQSKTETTTSVKSIDLSKYTKLKFSGVTTTAKVTLGVDGATVVQNATTGADVLVDISNVNTTAKKIKMTITAYSNSGGVTETASVAKIELLP